MSYKKYYIKMMCIYIYSDKGKNITQYWEVTSKTLQGIAVL